MSRDISIWYEETIDGESTKIEIRPPYYIFGTQQTSKQFWSLPILQHIGIAHLSELGHTDPVFFVGWDMIAELSKEIRLFQDNIQDIEFHSELKASWLAHLVYCYNLLVMSTPHTSIPCLSIG